MSVGHADPGHDPREENAELQRPLPDGRHPIVVAEEAGAQRGIEPLLADRGDEGLDVLDIMLAVAVECDDDLGAAGKREVHARLQRRPLAPIDKVREDDGAGIARHTPGPIGGAVVHDDDVRNLPFDLPHDLAHGEFLVVRRDDHKEPLLPVLLPPARSVGLLVLAG